VIAISTGFSIHTTQKFSSESFPDDDVCEEEELAEGAGVGGEEGEEAAGEEAAEEVGAVNFGLLHLRQVWFLAKLYSPQEHDQSPGFARIVVVGGGIVVNVVGGGIVVAVVVTVAVAVVAAVVAVVVTVAVVAIGILEEAEELPKTRDGTVLQFRQHWLRAKFR